MGQARKTLGELLHVKALPDPLLHGVALDITELRRRDEKIQRQLAGDIAHPGGDKLPEEAGFSAVDILIEIVIDRPSPVSELDPPVLAGEHH